MTDFFIASLEDLSGLLDFRPSEMLGDSEVDLLMLCNLESILTGMDWESVFDRVYINPVKEQGPEGPWIYKVSEGLLDELKKLGPDAVKTAASEWAETDEWTLRADPKEKIASVLQGLIGLAKRAGTEGKSLFIWTDP